MTERGINVAAIAPTWIASFIGRKVGALGGSHRIITRVQGDSHELARLALYNHYEHIEALILQRIGTP